MNGDGIPDIVTINSGTFDVSVLLGNGDGGFKPTQQFAAEANGASIAVGDFNNDGIPDLVVPNNTCCVSLLLGNGDGTFQSPIRVQAGENPVSATVGDFNGDGNLDFAVARTSTDNIFG